MDEQTQYITSYETQIIERLARMETKIDHIGGVITAHDARLTSLEKAQPNADHESRLRRLEKAIWIAAGAAAAGGGAIGAIVEKIAAGG